jgi:hypothetical protein
MSKNRNKEDRVQESLLNQNRELKAENRRLHKLIKKLDRGFKRTLDHIENEDVEVPEEVQKLCFDCGGNYQVKILLNRRFRQCDQCGKRGKTAIL